MRTVVVANAEEGRTRQILRNIGLDCPVCGELAGRAEEVLPGVFVPCLTSGHAPALESGGKQWGLVCRNA